MDTLFLIMLLSVVGCLTLTLINAIFEVWLQPFDMLAKRIAEHTGLYIRQEMDYRSRRSNHVTDFNMMYGVDFIIPFKENRPMWYKMTTEPFKTNKILRAISQHYKQVIKKYQLETTVQELALGYLSLNVTHYSFQEKGNHKIYDDVIILKIEDYAMLVKNQVSIPLAMTLYKHGFSTEEVIEHKDIPAEWTANLYSTRTLVDNRY